MSNRTSCKFSAFESCPRLGNPASRSTTFAWCFPPSCTFSKVKSFSMSAFLCIVFDATSKQIWMYITACVVTRASLVEPASTSWWVRVSFVLPKWNVLDCGFQRKRCTLYEIKILSPHIDFAIWNSNFNGLMLCKICTLHQWSKTAGMLRNNNSFNNSEVCDIK